MPDTDPFLLHQHSILISRNLFSVDKILPRTPLTYSFNKHLLRSSYWPGIVLGLWGVSVSQTDRSVSHGSAV